MFVIPKKLNMQTTVSPGFAVMLPIFYIQGYCIFEAGKFQIIRSSDMAVI